MNKVLLLVGFIFWTFWTCSALAGEVTVYDLAKSSEDLTFPFLPPCED